MPVETARLQEKRRCQALCFFLKEADIGMLTQAWDLAGVVEEGLAP